MRIAFSIMHGEGRAWEVSVCKWNALKSSLVPMPEEEEKEGPGFSRLRMTHINVVNTRQQYCLLYVPYSNNCLNYIMSSDDLSLVPRHQIFCAHPAALSKNRVWTLSLVTLGRNHMSVSACCRTNQIAQVK